MRLVPIVLLALAVSTSGVATQGAPIGAYPSGSGPGGPALGAYPTPLGTPSGGTQAAPVETPLHHDQTVEYCRSQPGACNVKQPDNHDLAQHQLDEAAKPLQQQQVISPPGPPEGK